MADVAFERTRRRLRLPARHCSAAAALLLCAAALGGSSAAQSQPSVKLKLTVGLLPHAGFVERVGGERVEVAVLVGPGQSPHSFEPSPRQIAHLADSQAYFRAGVPFEERLCEKIAAQHKGVRIVDLNAGIALRKSEAACQHEDHEGHDHAAGAPDPHTWLDPKNAKLQARTICETLCQLDPPGSAEYRKNLAAFETELDQLDERLRTALAPYKGREIFVFHPAFGYFADAYGLRQTAVEIDGKEPTVRQLGEIIRRAREAGARVIFVQPQFPAKSAETIAREIGGSVVALDDLAKDYAANLERMTDAVRRGFAKP